MGFFSWHTDDTKKSIPCSHSDKDTFTVFMHDAKGTGSDISAMVNGHRIFVVQKTDKKEAGTVQHVSLDDFGK